MTRPVITLLTDFGSTDSYVGQMKGAILSVCPEATVIDLTHQIPPQDVGRAAAVLAEAVATFPPHTVHVAVVDPGVGSSRRILAVEFASCRVVAPDNGLLTGLLRQQQPVRTVEVTDSRWWRPTVSSTFHGRDIMGPVAAHWSLGVDMEEFGPELGTSPVQLAETAPVQVQAGRIIGQVETIDHFGNLLTSITRDDLRHAGIHAENYPQIRITAGAGPDALRLTGLCSTYASTSPGSPLAILSSGNRLEIAVRNGSAQQLLPDAKNAVVQVQLVPPSGTAAESQPDE